MSSLKHKKIAILFSMGCCLGAVIFLMIYGFNVVIPTYDDWIFASESDRIQHYIGWEYYRQTPWKFPVGLTEGLTSDGEVSCMYTDSIPLFAVFFKLLSPILPKTFQYIGLWELISFSLMGGLSAILLWKFRKSYIFCLTGAIPYIIAPQMIQRAFGHEALSGQWIIITALLLLVYSGHEWSFRYTPVIIWTILGMISAWVHIYFVPMIYMVMTGYILIEIMRRKNHLRSVLTFLSTTVFTLISMYIIGAFYGATSYKAGGLGVYSANLNTFFNSYGVSNYLKPLAFVYDTIEGLGYLGLGIILLLFVGIIIIFNMITEKNISILLKNRKAEIMAVALIFALSLFFALSPRVSLNSRILYEINYPEKIINILQIFRASGRFIWIADFIVYTGVFAVLSKIKNLKTIVFTAMLCVFIQYKDLSDYISGKHVFFSNQHTFEIPMKDEKWKEIAENKSEIIFMPLHEDYLSHMAEYYSFAQFAYLNNMKLSSFYLARVNYDSLAKYAQEEYERVIGGTARNDVIYVFFEADEIPENDVLDIYEADGFTIGVSK